MNEVIREKRVKKRNKWSTKKKVVVSVVSILVAIVVLITGAVG
jgi:hypothetical protein